jgi:hypothetical protein
MEFTKRLHAGIQRGEVTCSVRVAQHSHLSLEVVELALREAYGLVAPKSLTRPSRT